MEFVKLKSIRTGNRSAVTRLFRKFDEAKESTDFDKEELIATFENLSQKKKLLESLNDQIMNLTDTEDMEKEIVETDEYTTNLDTKLRHFRNFIEKQSVSPNSNEQARSSYQILNVESPAFIPANNTGITQTNYAAPSIEHTSYTTPSYNAPLSAASNHRLPKLTLPTFTGNILEWQGFWDSFESAVHSNPTLTDVQKFNYLKAQLEHEASRTIAGFAVTNGNYTEAVNVLNERFGQSHRIIEAHMQALLDITPPRNNITSLRNFYDKMESLVRGLESLGQTQDSFGTLLVPIIINKLPGEIRRHLAREHGPTYWLLRDLRKGILNEIQIMEAGPDTESTYNIPTSAFFTGAKSPRKQTFEMSTPKSTYGNLTEKPCIFCNEIHSPTYCANIVDRNTRLSIVKRNNLCFNCLGTHYLRDCNSTSSCRNCNQRHHTSLCNGFCYHNPLDKYNNTQSAIQDNRGKYQNLSAPPTSVNEKNEDTAILHSSAQIRSNVLLKTAVAPVWSEGFYADTNILFDEGAQRSFVTENLANKLKLPREEAENIQLSSFGTADTHARRLDKSTVHIETESGKKIPIEVLIVPMIAVPLQNSVRYIDRNSTYLKTLKLAHPDTQDDTFEISFLIGADFYWEIVEDQVIRGNGPTAVKSKLGYLLSGPLHAGKSNSTTTSVSNVLESQKSEEHNVNTSRKESIEFESSEIQEKETDKPSYSNVTTSNDISLSVSINDNVPPDLGGYTQSAIVRTQTRNTTRPIVKLYPLELNMEDQRSEEEPKDPTTTNNSKGRTFPIRKAAQRARENIKQWTS